MKKIILLTFVLSVFIVSCDFGMTTTELDKPVYKKTSRNIDNSKGGFDLLPFFDVTLKNVDANDVMIEEFNKLTGYKYKNRNGGILTFYKNKGTVSYSISEIQINGITYKSVKFTYEYILKAASKNLVYLCPKNYRNIKVYADGQELSGREFSSFAFYIPMYGFGEGRIEVSNHLKGESLINNGTYWAY